jgi:hypothetical protein
MQHVTERAMADDGLKNQEIVLTYHERTKHHFHRFAASAGAMDWATQPNPFRRYNGAPLVRLPFPQRGPALPYWQLYVADSIDPAPLSIDSVSLFFRHALSLTAWKQFGETTWALRANPSSGNLHPTEGYALLPPWAGNSSCSIVWTPYHSFSDSTATPTTSARSENIPNSFPFGAQYLILAKKSASI